MVQRIGKTRQPPPAHREIGRPRGILRHAAGPGRFHHVRLAPAPELAGLVQHFWIVSWDLEGGTAQRHEVLPHPNVHLVLAPGDSRVHGIHTGRFTRVLQGNGGVFGIKFRPGGFRPFLQAPVSGLRDRGVPASALFGDAVQMLEVDVFAAGDDEAMVAAVERFLLARWPAPDPQVERVAAMVDDIAEDRHTTRVDQVLGRWRLGARALQRLFNEYVGVGPKWVINRYRLHEAVERLAHEPPPDWAQLALDLGYFDQAHFIRDFKAMTGHTPVNYALGEPRADA